VSNAARQL